MKIIEPFYSIEAPIPFDAEAIMRRLERAARTCYKSEDKIGPGTADKLIRAILKRGHESVIEHESITVRFICDRGVTHELVRHRLCAFSQESTRYCNYGKVGEVTFIKPLFWNNVFSLFSTWRNAMQHAEDAYLNLLTIGASPQEARSVLPNSLKTEIVTTANLREWRHIFHMRCSSAAHPQMRQLMVPLQKELAGLLPIIFGETA